MKLKPVVVTLSRHQLADRGHNQLQDRGQGHGHLSPVVWLAYEHRSSRSAATKGHSSPLSDRHTFPGNVFTTRLHFFRTSTAL